MRIFISYSSKDRDRVTSLADDLQVLGHEVWFDGELTRAGGQKWWSNILDNLRRSDVFIFALTPNSLASDPCKREYRYASGLRKRILPVMMENVELAVLPADLQELQFVDYRAYSSKQGIALAATLSNLPPPPPVPDPLPPEPETPLPPLAQMAQSLEASALSGAEQAEIVLELERLLRDPATHAGAEALLRSLYARDDLTNRVGEKIRMLVSDMGAGLANQHGAENRMPGPSAAEKKAREIKTESGTKAPAVAQEAPSSREKQMISRLPGWALPVIGRGLCLLIGGTFIEILNATRYASTGGFGFGGYLWAFSIFLAAVLPARLPSEKNKRFGPRTLGAWGIAALFWWLAFYVSPSGAVISGSVNVLLLILAVTSAVAVSGFVVGTVLIKRTWWRVAAGVLGIIGSFIVLWIGLSAFSIVSASSAELLGPIAGLAAPLIVLGALAFLPELIGFVRGLLRPTS